METQNNQLGRAEVLEITPQDYILPQDLLPDSPTPEYSIMNQTNSLEQESVLALLDILRSGKSGDRLKAATVSLKAIGKDSPKHTFTNIDRANNVQINNIMNSPDLLAKLRSAGDGLSSIAEAQPADLIISGGGRGL